jgi:hypothetical protein
MRTLWTFTLMVIALTPLVVSAQDKGKQKAVPQTQEVKIAAIHDGDTTVTGTSPVPNVALTVKINGAPGPNTINANASGSFTFALASPAKGGNFVEVSGISGGKQLYGNVTVAAAPVKLTKPTISAKFGDNFIVVTRNSADASVAGLTIHLLQGPLSEPSCTPDDSTGLCRITLPLGPLKVGDTVRVREEAAIVQGLEAVATIPAPAALAKPTISSVAEGDQSVTVTADKGDLTRTGLTVRVSVRNQNGAVAEAETHVCVPDSTNGQCSVKTGKLRRDQVVEASEFSDDGTTGPKTEARITARASLNKPSIKAVQGGDDTITVILNTNDKQAGILIGLRVCSDYLKDEPCQPLEGYDKTCAPDDSSGSCQIKLKEPVLAGDTIQAWETWQTSLPLAGDGIATFIVAPQAELGLPIIAPTKESDTTVKITLNSNDVKKWGTNLSVYLSRFSGGDQIANKTCAPAAGQDNCTITLDSPLAAGEVLHINVAVLVPAGSAAATVFPTKPGPEILVNVPELGFDWGRVRAYFSLGAVFSRSTTTTPAAGGTPATSDTNFSSPDVFAGLDIDFNWYSAQRCLAYPFGEEHVKLPTVADAAAQCGKRGGSASRGDYGRRFFERLNIQNRQKDQKQQQSKVQSSGSQHDLSLDAMEYTTDPSLLTMIEFLASIGTNLPPRLETVKQDLQNAAEKMTADRRAAKSDRVHLIEMTKAFNQLKAVELTPQETREILTQFGYETYPQHGWMINSYVLNRLTQTSASNGFTLTNSPNSVHLEGGIYAPFYFGWSRWPYKGEPHALFLAPIGKLGFDSLRSSGTDPILLQAKSQGDSNYANAVTALSKDIYRMMAFGGRLGMFTFSSTPNRAPEQIMTVDFTYGRYDNFFTQKFGDTTGAVRFPWRFGLNSRLKIPSTGFYVGADLTKGVGPDDLKIYVGGRADLSALLGKLIPSTK